MAYFGFSFHHMKEKRNLGVMIVDGDNIQHAVEKMIEAKAFPPEIEDGTACACASEIAADQLRYYPLEMFNTLMSLEKMKEYVEQFETKEEPTAH